MDDCRRPLQALIEAAGAEYIAAVPTGLDPVGRLVQLSSGHTLPYDVLAVNLEPLIDRSALEAEMPGARQNAMFLHPLEAFGQLWPQLEALAQRQAMHVAILGFDMSAVELALCAARGLWEPQGSRVSLLTHGHELMRGAPPRLRQKALARLRQLGVATVPTPVLGFTPGKVHLEGELTLACDAPVIALPPKPAAWLSHTGLVVDNDGFAEVNERLQSESHRQIFIAHDASDEALGPVFENNLRVALQGGNFKNAPRQGGALRCLSSGQRQAIVTWGPLSLEGREVWNWKHRRDARLFDSLVPAPIE
jgi:NADH dehydrogenase FAD-containing subunit